MRALRLILLATVFTSAQLLPAQNNVPESSPVADESALLLRRIASLRDRLARVRMVSFEKLHLADQNKSAGIIAELLNRAEQRIYNLIPPGRYGWSWEGFDPPREMVAHAEGLLNTLALGKDPFEGKYAEPGVYVVDHALVKKDGLHHLIYIRATAVTSWPEYPAANFGHAVSRDLVRWQTEDPVLQCPTNGWDRYQVWAPHVIEHKGTYYMFYAGVNTNACQAICLATSADLNTWTRSEENPVITTEGWGLWNVNQWSDCRDPMILNDGDMFYCYYTAMRLNVENGKPESCIGISSSADLLRWKHEGFIRLENSLTTPPESPFVVRRNGTYYLFYSNYKYGTVYVASDHPVKGWKEPPVEKMALMGGVSASEIYQDNDNWYMSYISHQKNGLHFFEICKLQWDKDGHPSVDTSTREASVSAAFGQAMRGGMKVPGLDDFRRRPLTVECWARLDSAAAYNVLVACDAKASAEHWSLYSAAGSGVLSLFQTGRGGDFTSAAVICDGKWHYVAAVIDPERVRLFVDGELVKDAPATACQGGPLPGDLAFGRLVEGGLSCDGALDNVRVSRGAREISGLPAGPLAQDAATLGLWDF